MAEKVTLRYVLLSVTFVTFCRQKLCVAFYRYLRWSIINRNR